jgi:hypothetical protein
MYNIFEEKKFLIMKNMQNIKFMDFKNLYNQEEKKQIIFAKKYRKRVVSIELDTFLKFFHSCGFSDFELVIKDILSNRKRINYYTSNILRNLKNFSKEYIDKIYSSLTPRDSIKNIPKNSLIFIYGSNSDARAIFGSEIYNHFKVPVVVSGKGESERYRRVLIENNILEKDIFEEKNAKNFIENAFYSIELAKEKRILQENIILITASLVSLRALKTTEIFLKEKTKIYSLPIEFDYNIKEDPTSPDNWFKNDIGIQTFLSEIMKLYLMKKEGIFE